MNKKLYTCFVWRSAPPDGVRSCAPAPLLAAPWQRWHRQRGRHPADARCPKRSLVQGAPSFREGVQLMPDLDSSRRRDNFALKLPARTFGYQRLVDPSTVPELINKHLQHVEVHPQLQSRERNIPAGAHPNCSQGKEIMPEQTPDK
eukprot:3072311-Pyramimonas_sp.AAC.1